MKKTSSAFTIVRNEPFFLRAWCNYYGNFFPHEDLYVLDNSSDDGSVEDVKSKFPNINFVEIPSELAYDHNWLRDTVQNFQRSLFESYNVVLFAESDEFLFVDESVSSNIYEYCNAFSLGKIYNTESFLRSTAWEVVHNFRQEKPLKLDTNKTIHLLEDRRDMYRLPQYDKSLITKVPLRYCRGFHLVIGAENHPTKDSLSMLHAQKVDLDYYINKTQTRGLMKIKNGFNGSADRVKAEKDFIDAAANPATRRDIPATWRELLTY